MRYSWEQAGRGRQRLEVNKVTGTPDGLTLRQEDNRTRGVDTNME